MFYNYTQYYEHNEIFGVEHMAICQIINIIPKYIIKGLYARENTCTPSLYDFKLHKFYYFLLPPPPKKKKNVS